MQVSQQTTDTTIRKSARRSKRDVRQAPGFNLIPAAVTACVVLLTGIVATPPRYIARAAFVVNWNSLVSAPDNAQAEKARNECRMTVIAAVTSLPDSEHGMSEVLDRAAGFSGSLADKAAMISKLHRRLHVTLAGQADQGDLFTIETRDNNPDAAQTAANWVLRGTVAKLTADIKSRSELAALRSPAEAGAGSLSKLGGEFFAGPIRVVKEAQIKTRGIGYGLSVLLAALVLGGFAAGFGWLRHQVELVLAALNATARSAARRAAAESPSSGRRRLLAPSRPILLRPLPQYCLTANLYGAGSLGNDLPQVSQSQTAAQAN
jgi:hypothetical protein